jgi:hypothetical protein
VESRRRQRSISDRTPDSHRGIGEKIMGYVPNNQIIRRANRRRPNCRRQAA